MVYVYSHIGDVCVLACLIGRVNPARKPTFIKSSSVKLFILRGTLSKQNVPWSFYVKSGWANMQKTVKEQMISIIYGRGRGWAFTSNDFMQDFKWWEIGNSLKDLNKGAEFAD